MSLRKKTGNEPEVRDYVLNCKEAGMFLDKVEDLLVFLVPQYIKEGKNQLVIAVGCTGGKHRSVTMAQWNLSAAGSEELQRQGGTQGCIQGCAQK